MNCVSEQALTERVTRLEQDVSHIQEGNKLFRDEMRDNVSEIKKQNEAIYEIAGSIKLIAQDMQTVKGDIKEVKAEQKELSRKMDDEIATVKEDQEEIKEKIVGVDGKDASKALKFLGFLKEKLAWLIVGAAAAYLLYQALPFLK